MSHNSSAQGRSNENDTSPGPGNSNAAYYFNLQAPTPQQRSSGGQPFNLPGQRRMPQGATQTSPDGALNMGSMVGALPAFQQSNQTFVHPQNTQRIPSGTSSSTFMHQLPSSSFAGQTSMNNPGYNAAFNPQFAGPFPSNSLGRSDSQQYSSHQPSQQGQHGGPSPLQPPYPSPSYFPSQQQQFMFYPTPYGQMSPSQQHFQGRSNVYPPSYRRLSQSYAQGAQQQQLDMINSMQSGFSPGGPGGPVGYGQGTGGPYLRPEHGPGVSRESSGSSVASIPSVPRGPPRKPKQSGNALWVGNLPPGTVVTDLKDHFSRDATNDIESVFLISKSNCAFVNYRTEVACSGAMTRFHDSRFQGVRLVCRLRRSSTAPAPGVPTGPAALAPAIAQTQSASEAIAQNREVSSQAEEAARLVDGSTKTNEKYFVVKSLTVEDLELSARNGIWATQAHNEAALNKAFETTENVYLIFSANKSGEYFGYARMVSPINDDASADLDWAPRAEAIADDPDLPRSIPTIATEFAPRGRIIDDSARGTIFWEADPTGQDIHTTEVVDEPKVEESADEGEGDVSENIPGAHTFGKPFKIEWLSTVKLPFYRTRGLRNPWNANREVKIARDGTELETSVGRRLVQMFHRPILPPEAPHPAPGIAYPTLRPY